VPGAWSRLDDNGTMMYLRTHTPGRQITWFEKVVSNFHSGLTALSFSHVPFIAQNEWGWPHNVLGENTQITHAHAHARAYTHPHIYTHKQSFHFGAFCSQVLESIQRLITPIPK